MCSSAIVHFRYSVMDHGFEFKVISGFFYCKVVVFSFVQVRQMRQMSSLTASHFRSLTAMFFQVTNWMSATSCAQHRVTLATRNTWALMTTLVQSTNCIMQYVYGSEQRVDQTNIVVFLYSLSLILSLLMLRVIFGKKIDGEGCMKSDWNFNSIISR